MNKPTHLYFFLFLSFCLTTLSIISTSNASNNNIDQTTNLFKLVKSRRARHPSLSASWLELPNPILRAQVHVAAQDGLMEADKITLLPGQPSGIDFDQYSGYVTVDPGAEKGLFYYFAEAPHNASSKPLVLWLNGGPGCSSFGNGGLLELGPFRVSSNGKSLIRNKYSWNNVANVLFLESPAGVGFSYGNVSAIYQETGDLSTAKDAYIFLVNWLERFPQYKNRDFYLTGESYAGHYVPQLAYTILQNNKLSKQNFINLKGIAIGNAWIDDITNTAGLYDFLWSHAMYSDETHAKITKYCNFSASITSKECDEAGNEVVNQVGNIDIYNIYAPICRSFGKDQPAHILDSVEVFDPCASNYVDTYLNTEEVQKALHVKPTNWSACSGDVDGRVPVTSSKYSINTLKLGIKSPWRPWYTEEEVGGYVVEYEGLVFVTVRGAGHLVPSYQPLRALTMISAFLQGTLPPQS
ncbi:hypothetical protein Cgig2_022506 [Carnegiea gigantea]|uniref:Carboxypeptidase n=1 Tax=Carnegiea gigantea TaxID=171969 RepID=A0A9Q1K9H7_9CARY|nr:hypothetical protein Cgig2_022506 [Carnegiea gigantea]